MTKAERRHRTECKIKQRLKVLKTVLKDGKEWNSFKVRNRNNKRHPLDCGRAKCGLCSGHKLFKKPRPLPPKEDQDET